MIVFRRKTAAEWLTVFILFMPFMFFVLMDLMRVPPFIKYTVDIAWFFSLASILNIKNRRMDRSLKSTVRIMLVFLIMTLFVYVLQYQSVLYYLWGLRNNIRFYVFFFACTLFMRGESIESYLKIFDKLFWINVPVIAWQYFVMGKDGDRLGGIFGVETGCNGYINIFLMIVVAKAVLKYLNHQEKTGQVLIKSAISLLIAVFTELKVFFIEFALIILLAVVFTGHSNKKYLLVASAAVGVIVAIDILQTLFPIFSGWLNPARIWETVTSTAGYTMSNDMNRLTAVGMAVEQFLPSLFDKMFGLGLGNCDYASFEFLITPFYRTYGHLHYMWFSSAVLTLETGLIGLGLYGAFFVSVFFAAKKKQLDGNSNALYCQLSRIMAVMGCVLIVYNSSLRTEAGFMVYFILALPFLVSTNRNPTQEVFSCPKSI